MNGENFEELVRNIIVNLQATQDEKIKRIADAIRCRIVRKDLTENMLRGRIAYLEERIAELKDETPCAQ